MQRVIGSEPEARTSFPRIGLSYVLSRWRQDVPKDLVGFVIDGVRCV